MDPKIIFHKNQIDWSHTALPLFGKKMKFENDIHLSIELLITKIIEKYF